MIGAVLAVTLYLNADGGTLTTGWDDASANVSSLVERVGGSVTIPRYRGGAKRWKQVVACVRERYADFDIDVVTERPAGGPYVMVMVGGRPSLFDYPRAVSGVAPYTGEVIEGAVVYAFSEAVKNDVEMTCVSILHESGHALGLDHAYLCEDPMSYRWGCGKKRWRDEDAYCGEGEPRSCGDGEATQNSYRRLAANVGLRGGEPVPEEPDVGPPYDFDPGDGDAPTVAIDGADGELSGNQWIEVVVRAADDRGVAEVELGWASEDAQYVFPCSDPGGQVAVTCEREGDAFRFRLHVGTGVRAMVARATDVAGNQSVSEPRVLYLRE